MPPATQSADTAATQPPSTAYARLHPKIQKWIYTTGWNELRDVQEQAIPAVLDGQRDVIIAAATASGKTEAAWLPICSALLQNPQPASTGHGLAALYIGPLKALINDQHERLSHLCQELDLSVHRWHGDVPASQKKRLLQSPEGILLITPESLEAMFVNHGDRVGRIFGALRYIVIDELHAFIGTERGAQLQSVMHRIELVIRRHVARVALSATLGDFTAAQDFLRPGRADTVLAISSTDDAGEIRLQLRGYIAADPTKPRPGQPEPAESADDQDLPHQAAIASHLFSTLRGKDNLVFANSRQAVETYTDILTRRCDTERVPAEFVPHHGNLSKEIREHVESRLKDRSTPVTAICTSTLEMGIDIGSVDSIAQIGAPFSVSGLRQRLGRSGRRAGQPAVLRLYVTEQELTDRTTPIDALRSQTFQSVAMVELLLRRWYEPPDQTGLHLSTLIQQILSIIAQRGGAHAGALYDALCGHGPFRNVDRDTFIALLRQMGTRDLLTQDTSGLLLAGGVGDRIINHHTFYTAFHTPEEYRLVANGKTLGSLPIDHPVSPNSLLIFSGRRWRVLDIDPRQKIIELVASAGGRPPTFPGAGGQIADEVRRNMRALYTTDDVPAYLDRGAQQLLAEGRAAFDRHGHAHRAIHDWGNDTLIFPWRGDRIMNTLAAVLVTHDYEVGQDGIALNVRGTTVDDLRRHLGEISRHEPPSVVTLAASVIAKAEDKHDEHLDETLLDKAYAARALDVNGAWSTLKTIAATPTTTA